MANQKPTLSNKPSNNTSSPSSAPRLSLKTIKKEVDVTNEVVRRANIKIDELAAIQSKLDTRQKKQDQILYLGWIVILITVAALLVTVVSLVLDFLYFKSELEPHSHSESEAGNIIINISKDEERAATSTKFKFNTS